jgi:hypothetical protein
MRTADLASTYQSKSDDELLSLVQSEGLSAEAQFVLQNELKRRGIDLTLAIDNARQPEPIFLDKFPQPVRKSAHSVTEFTSAVTRMYCDHFVLFMKVTVPAMAISGVAITVGLQKGRELLSQMFVRPGDYKLIWLKITLLANGAHLIGGLASCASFAAICVAVARITAGSSPLALACLAEIRKRIAPVLRLSLLLIVLIWLAIMISSTSIAAVFFFFPAQARVNSIAIRAIGWTVLSLGLLLVSRFGLAMPAVMLDNYKVGRAMFRSDELTERKWLTLAILLIKSVFGGYIAAMLPFWIAPLIWRYEQLPPWYLTLASYLGVTLVEPFMFIGFALLYIRMSSQTSGEKAEITEAAAAGFNSQ